MVYTATENIYCENMKIHSIDSTLINLEVIQWPYGKMKSVPQHHDCYFKPAHQPHQSCATRSGRLHHSCLLRSALCYQAGRCAITQPVHCPQPLQRQPVAMETGSMKHLFYPLTPPTSPPSNSLLMIDTCHK